MCGSETFTTVVSSTTMNVALITAIAVSQGLTEDAAPATEAFLMVFQRSKTVTVTDMPGRSGCAGSWPPSSTMRTGTR